MEQLYVNILRRWTPLIIVAGVLAGLTAYLVARQQPRFYEASTRLIIGPGIDGLSPDLNDLRAGGQLMQTSAELATTRPVLETVIEELGLAQDFDDLEEDISVSVDEETQILKIDVRDRRSEDATNVANVLASVLLRLSPSGGESSAAVLNAQMLNQAADIEETILEIERRIELRNTLLDDAESAEEQRLLIDQIASDRARLADSQATLAVLYNSLRNTPTNQVKIVELAVLGEPVQRRLPLVALVAAAAGMVLALVIALVFEYFDDSVLTVDELNEITGLPVLGTITQTRKRRRDAAGSLLVVKDRAELPESEDYRMLATKLPISSDGQRLSSLAISSIQDSKEAGEVASNLAVVLAQLGRRVILVDANLHTPTIQRLFGTANRSGLTQHLTGQSGPPELSIVDWAPGLSILTAGAPTSDAFAKLTSHRTTALLQHLVDQSDIVILVTSPVASFADSLLITGKSGGVALVVRGGDVGKESVQKALFNLQSTNANVIGTVFIGRSLSLNLSLPSVRRSSRMTEALISSSDEASTSAGQPSAASNPRTTMQQNWSESSRQPAKQDPLSGPDRPSSGKGVVAS